MINSSWLFKVFRVPRLLKSLISHSQASKMSSKPCAIMSKCTKKQMELSLLNSQLNLCSETIVYFLNMDVWKINWYNLISTFYSTLFLLMCISETFLYLTVVSTYCSLGLQNGGQLQTIQGDYLSVSKDDSS